MRTLAHLTRRLFLLGFAAAALAAAPPPGPAPDVVGFRGPNRDGRFAGTLPHRRPAALWSVATEAPVHGSPIWDRGRIVFGSGDGVLRAVDSGSGAEIWRYAAGAPLDGPAAVAADRVIVESRDGWLHAVDAATGVPSWKVALGADLDFRWGWDYFLSGPAVEGSRVFVGSGAGEVLAVEAATGTIVWRFPTGSRVRSSPTVAGGVVYVGSFDGYLYALDEASGALRWKFATAGVAIDLEAAGFDRRSIQSSPAVTADRVVVGGRDGYLYGVDRATGGERWRFDHEMSWVVGSPAIAGDRALVGSSDGRFVQAVDLASGRELWRTRVDSNALSSPAVAGDVVVVGEGAGNLVAFDVATGLELWRFPTGGAVHASPLVHDGRIYFGSDDGRLYALAGDLAAPARRTVRAVYYDARVPYRNFQGDREVRDRLAAESYRTVSRRDVAAFLEERVAARSPSVLVFATDDVPTSLLEESTPGGSLVRRYLDSGGKIVWLGGLPLAVTFDPASGKLADAGPEALRRAEALLGVGKIRWQEGECRASATPIGRRWGLPAEWWADEAPLVDPGASGVESLALDEHGHAAAWVKRFGGPEGTGFVRYWAREDRLADPGVVLALAEYGLP